MCEDSFRVLTSKCRHSVIYTRQTIDLLGYLTLKTFPTLQILEETLPCLRILNKVKYGVCVFQFFDLFTW
jgi:hypothetical protein